MTRQRIKEWCIAAGLATIVSVVGMCTHADARPRHHRYTDGNGNASEFIGGRPSGCPRAYCGCGLALYLGIRDRALDLADAWGRKFNHTSAHAGAVAVRRYHKRGHGHVMLLQAHISGTRWRVVDFNSGSGLSRVHVRDVRGYYFVDPGAHTASL